MVRSFVAGVAVASPIKENREVDIHLAKGVSGAPHYDLKEP